MGILSSLTSLLALTAAIDARSVTKDVAVTGPTPRLIVYVQTFHVNGDQNTPLSLLPLIDAGITHVIFAMTHLNDAPGDIHLNDNPYNASIFDQAWSDAKQLQAAGVKVLATMGGAGDGSYSHLASNFDAYYDPLRDLIKQYDLDGFDLDVEEPVDIGTALQLINALRNDMGPDFLITLAPVASALASRNGGDLSGFNYFDLDAQAVASDGSKLVSWYNGQFYSGFGSPASTSTYDSIVSAGWDPARVVMGVLDSPNDGGGYVATSTLESTVRSLKAKYPTFGGVDGWEYFDAGVADGDSQPSQWVSAVGSALFGTSGKRDVETAVASSAFPEHPFADSDVASLTASGASHYEAIRALNRTGGDLAAAQNYYSAWAANL
ncbi:glycoside hydrolase family 18 protein, partial [Xylogone sp. PMI_703]